MTCSNDEALCALSQAPGIFFALCKRNGQIIFSSGYAYGFTSEGVIGKQSAEPVVEECLPAWHAAFNRARDGGEVVRLAVKARSPEREVVTAVQMSPVRDQTGGVAMVLIVSIAPAAVSALAATVEPLVIGEFLSYDDANICGVLFGKGWMTSEKIAAAAGEVCGMKFRTLLANLAARGVIEGRSGQGYRTVSL